jgi:ABC-type spermidine/putrescine transport system permease subunit I
MLVLFFAVPLLTMIGQSLTAKQGMFATYHNILTQPGLLIPMLYTFGVALTVTLFALVLSYPVAFVISSLRGRLFTLSMALILIPFWTSTVIRTYAWIVLLQRRGVLNELLLASGIITHPLRLTGSDFGMQIAMVHIMLPFMMLPLLNTMRGIDRSYLRAASVLGANPFWQFTRVFLPLSLPGVSAGCTLGGSNTMIAVLIEQEASRLLDWPTASALGTVLLVLTCLLYVVYERAMQWAAGSHPA